MVIISGTYNGKYVLLQASQPQSPVPEFTDELVKYDNLSQFNPKMYK